MIKITLKDLKKIIKEVIEEDRLALHETSDASDELTIKAGVDMYPAKFNERALVNIASNWNVKVQVLDTTGSYAGWVAFTGSEESLFRMFEVLYDNDEHKASDAMMKGLSGDRAPTIKNSRIF